MSIAVLMGGASYDSVQFATLQPLFARAYYDSNIISVAASGNHARQDTTFPAAFGEVLFGTLQPPAPNMVIGVGSHDADNDMCLLSTWDKNLYDFMAPGGTWGAWAEWEDPESVTYGYIWRSCFTSIAAPHFAGIAALVWSAFPEKTNTEIIDRLRENADPVYLNEFRYGRVDAFEAIVAWDRPVWEDTVRLYGTW